MKFLPIDVKNWYEVDPGEIQVEGTMNRDFGPWKCGDSEILHFNFNKGKVVSYSYSGAVDKEVKIRLEVKEDDKL